MQVFTQKKSLRVVITTFSMQPFKTGMLFVNY